MAAGVPSLCARGFPVLIHGRTYWIKCTLPRHGSDVECEGMVREYGKPRF